MAARLIGGAILVLALGAAPVAGHAACQFNDFGDITNPNDPSCRDVQLRYTRDDSTGNNIALGYDVPFPVDSLTPIDGYRSYQSLHERHQSLDALSENAAGSVVGASLSGRDIWAYRIGDPDNQTVDGGVEAAVYINGTTHAREWQSPEGVTEVFEQLTEIADDDGLGAYFKDNLNVVIVPVLNVDGFLQTQRFPDRMTADEQQPRDGRQRRKNLRNPNTGGPIDESLDQTSDNFYGIDLNRNNPNGFGQNNGSSNNVISLVYRGQRPQTEPEIQALLAAATLGPGDRLRMYSDVHSFSQIFFTPMIGDLRRDNITTDLVRRMRFTLNSKYRYGPSSSSGIGLTSDYFAFTFRIPSWTLETEPLQPPGAHGHSGFILPESEVARMRDEVALMLLTGLYVQTDKPRVQAIRIRDVETNEVRYAADWQAAGSGRSLSVTTNNALVPGRSYDLWLGFNKPMRWRNAQGDVTNYPGQQVPLFPDIDIEFPALEAANDIDVAGDASAWRSAPGDDGYLRYEDDALITQFTIPATLPIDGPTAAGFAVEARDMTQARLDSKPDTRTDWDNGHWVGYEDSNGNQTDTGGTDCSFVAFVSTDPAAAAPAGEDACRVAAAPPPAPPPPAPTPTPAPNGGGGGGGGAVLWLLPLLTLSAVARRRYWRR
jgi:hypothetical protein